MEVKVKGSSRKNQSPSVPSTSNSMELERIKSNSHTVKRNQIGEGGGKEWESVKEDTNRQSEHMRRW